LALDSLGTFIDVTVSDVPAAVKQLTCDVACLDHQAVNAMTTWSPPHKPAPPSPAGAAIGSQPLVFVPEVVALALDFFGFRHIMTSL
jgi:hypothetical protein